MKTIYNCIIMVALLLTTVQILKGQTFDLGRAAEDSTMVKFIESWRRSNPDGPILIPVRTDSTNVQKPDQRETDSNDKTDSNDNKERNNSPFHPHIPNQFAINTGMTVGEIPMVHQVAPNGATTYTVPIECPPGRAGVQPSISLCYSSHGGNGVLGYGWSIGGLSSINRTTSNFYYDGVTNPVAMSATDFALDGGRLIQTSAASNVRTFVPVQGNVKIEAYMSGSYITQYFKVWFSNGSTAIYGYETNNVNKLSYPMTKMTDMHGNTIQYIYEEVNNQYYIKEIKYGSTPYLSYLASIEFQYTTRSDVSKVYEAGVEITENRLLDYIQCAYNGVDTRKYDFTYALNKVSLLTQIDCQLTSGGLNPLKFYYGTNYTDELYRWSMVLSSHYSNAPQVTSRGMFADDDGLIVYPNIHPYYEYQGRYENLFSPQQELLVYTDFNAPYAHTRTFSADNGFMQLCSGDVDGKAGDELIRINNTVSGNDDLISFTVHQYTSLTQYDPCDFITYKTVDYYPMPALNHPGGKCITPKVFLVGDFAGLGRMQVCAVSRYNPLGQGSSSRVMVFDIEKGTTLCNEMSSYLQFKASNTSSDIIFAMDVDGDGKAEICHIHEYGTDIYVFNPSPVNSSMITLGYIYTSISGLTTNTTTASKLMVGDINGDGKTDLVVSPAVNNNQWTIYYATGSNNFTSKTQTLMTHLATNQYVLQNMNGDGKADLICRDDNGDLSIYLASNDGFSMTPEPVSGIANCKNLIPSIVAQNNRRSQLIAFNDVTKLAEIFTFSRNDARERMMSASVNSLGVAIKTDYVKMFDANSSGVYYMDTGLTVNFPYDRFNSLFYWMTSKNQVWRDNALVDDNSYSYADAIIHRQGLGFCGFTDFYQYSRRGTLRHTFEPMNYGVLNMKGTPGTSAYYSYHVSVDAKKVLTVKPLQQRVADARGNTITTDFLTYDANNQPLTVETEYGYNSGIKTKQEYTYTNVNNSTTYLLGLPLEEKITQTRAGTSLTGKTNITYNSSWLPATSTTFADASGTLQTGHETFSYNSEGQLTNKSFKPFASSITSSISYNYEWRGFPVSVTDAMNHTSGFTYDYFGRVTESWNHLGNYSYYDYDALDRQTEIISPDGVTTQIAYTWNNNHNGSVIAVTSTATGRSAAVKYIDAFGRTTRESIVDFNGNPIYTDYLYDNAGRLWKMSEPYPAGSSPPYIEYVYDYAGRVTKTTHPSGAVTNIAYNGNTTTVVDAGMTTSKTYDATGALISATDPAGTITYTLRPDGQPASINVLGVVTLFDYDAYGRQTKITDPSAGMIQYQYNAEGLLSAQTNARNQTITYQYNAFGQPTQTVTPEQTLNYTYAPTEKWLTKIEAGTHFEANYGYDAWGRVLWETEKEGTVQLRKDYTYDAGRVKTVTYNQQPNDKLTYNYNVYGHLSSMQWGANFIYTVGSRNHFGQLTGYSYGNGVATTRTYSANGSPTNITTGSIFNQSYTFDDTKGLLSSRGSESFQYDILRRLTNYGNNTVQYNPLGNIIFKTDAGTLEYTDPSHPYQITGQTNFPPTVNTDPRTATFTSGERPASITKSGNTAEFLYNHAGERTKMTVTGAANYTRIYLGGNYEHEFSPAGGSGGGSTTEWLYLGGTAYNAPAVAKRTNGGSAWDLYYIHRDYLGSIVALTNSSGAVEQSNSYDAWGNRTLVSPTQMLQRGYTGHEHLPEFGLINMNARLYDPVIGRFLSPDPYVQAPEFSQSYNRYSYCLNNPLIYTDPTGEKWWKWVAIGLGLDALTGGAFSISALTTGTAVVSTVGTTAGTTVAVAAGTLGSTVLGAGFSALVTAQSAAWTLSAVDFSVTFFGSMFRKDGTQWGGKRFGNWLKTEAMPIVGIASLFDWDKSANGFEWFMQIMNKGTGEYLQNLVGYGFAHMQNIGGYIDKVGYYKGRATIRLNDGYIGNNLFSGISFGYYVFGHNMALNPNDHSQGPEGLDLFAHEFGHTYQSRISGPLYLFKYGIPSAAGGNSSEIDADRRGAYNLPHNNGWAQGKNRTKWWEVGLAPVLWPFMWSWNF